eukprot:TRINITY_DN11678_c1_g1_i5.p2 TRINITY_DN11678_c1_g1~~TRINITY_DN11678_c1_g1_i5.p2  ORF type:complete len:230 (+),score=-9.51 TRINITY_DN11678_c1_g1_i5:38-691(+)
MHVNVKKLVGSFLLATASFQLQFYLSIILLYLYLFIFLSFYANIPSLIFQCKYQFFIVKKLVGSFLSATSLFRQYFYFISCKYDPSLYHYFLMQIFKFFDFNFIYQQITIQQITFILQLLILQYKQLSWKIIWINTKILTFFYKLIQRNQDRNQREASHQLHINQNINLILINITQLKIEANKKLLIFWSIQYDYIYFLYFYILINKKERKLDMRTI